MHTRVAIAVDGGARLAIAQPLVRGAAAAGIFVAGAVDCDRKTTMLAGICGSKAALRLLSRRSPTNYCILRRRRPGGKVDKVRGEKGV